MRQKGWTVAALEEGKWIQAAEEGGVNFNRATSTGPGGRKMLLRQQVDAGKPGHRKLAGQAKIDEPGGSGAWLLTPQQPTQSQTWSYASVICCQRREEVAVHR